MLQQALHVKESCTPADMCLNKHCVTAISLPVDTSAASHRGTSPDEDIAILSAHESILLIHAGQRITLLQDALTITVTMTVTVTVRRCGLQSQPVKTPQFIPEMHE